MTRTKLLKGILYVTIIGVLGVVAYVIPTNTNKLMDENKALDAQIDATSQRIMIQQDFNATHDEALTDQKKPTSVVTEFLTNAFKDIESGETSDAKNAKNKASINAAKMIFGGMPGMKVSLDAMDIRFNELANGDYDGYGTVHTTTDARGLDIGHGKVTKKPESKEQYVLVTISKTDMGEYVVTSFKSGTVVKGANNDKKVR